MLRLRTGHNFNGERVNAGFQLFGEGCIDHPVLYDPGLAGKRLSHDPDAEVAFARRVAPGVAMMLVAFVDELQHLWCQRRVEFLHNGFANRAQIRHKSFPLNLEAARCSYHN